MEKSCVHSGRHNFDPIFLKLCKNINLHKSRPCLKLGHGGQKSRSPGQLIENHIVHIRFKISFTRKVIALRSRFQSFEILH